MHEASAGTSRREFLIFFYKHRMRLMASFLLPLMIAVALSFIPTPKYRATGVLIVRLGSEYVYQPEVGNLQNGNPTLPFQNDQIFKSEVAILSSQDLHRQVINTLGVDTLFPELAHPQGYALFMADVKKLISDQLKAWGLKKDTIVSQQQAEQIRLANAIAMFNKRLDIMLERESAVISVSFEHRDAQVAVRVLDSLLSVYYEKRKQLFIEPRAELAQSQMQATRSHAIGAQGAVESYKLKHKIYSLDDQRKQLLAERSEAQRQAQAIANPQLEAKIALYTQQLDQLDAQERGYLMLQKEAEIANESYSLYSHRFDEAKAYEELQRQRIGAVRTIQPPAASPEPKRIQPLIIMGGVFVAFLFTLLVAAMTEFSRRGFFAPEQIERSIGLPVLAVIPYQKDL